jgi:glycerophosphoryl diester phosphodiesterase
VAKDKILIDLDIKGSIPFEKIYQELVAENMVDQVFTISYRSLEEVKKYYGKYLDKILYFPAILKDIEDISAYIDEFETSINPFVYVPKFETDTSYIVNYLDVVTANHDKIWIHTISADRSGGYYDDRAVYDIEGSYGWLVQKGVDMIQTDRPQLLIEYLRKKGLHK